MAYPSEHHGARAIETCYAGYRFRSRLEARWAVLFDSLAVPWVYEPQGYHTPHGPYLPDFFLSVGNGSRGPWVEVKGAAPTETEVAKLASVCEQTNAYGRIVWDTPEDILFWAYGEDKTGQGVGAFESRQQWLSIHKEGFVDGESLDNFIQFDSWTDFGLCTLLGGAPPPDVMASYWNEAVQSARSARFEHGETPNLPSWTQALGCYDFDPLYVRGPGWVVETR